MTSIKPNNMNVIAIESIKYDEERNSLSLVFGDF